eukprot:g3892.t1
MASFASAREKSLTFARKLLETCKQSSPTKKGSSEVLTSWVNGSFVSRSASSSSSLLPVQHPANKNHVAIEFEPVLSPTSLDEVVEKASAAQREWAKYTGTERSRILREAAILLSDPEINETLAWLEAFETGRPIAETSIVDIVSARDTFEWFSSLAATGLHGDQVPFPEGSFAYTRREPLGVCAGIGAWNYPIQGMTWKVAPALACGNAILFKPAEDTILTALALGPLLQAAGLPDGLFNVVLGAGETGAKLTEHPKIAKVSFTGDYRTGKKVMKSASNTLKHVTMELGGKSPLIIFNDCDISNAVNGAMMANFYSCGEVCSNGTRVFVERDIMETFTNALVAKTSRLKLGDPMHPETDIGCLIHNEHAEKVQSYVDGAQEEGAKVLCGGKRLLTDQSSTFFEPTILTECTDDMTIIREEVFGPVLTLLPFDTEEEVIERANATPFGLSAGVFTKDLAKAHRVTHEIQAGTTWINNYNLAPVELPWGGFKQSGLGRENGLEALESWSQVKSVYVEMGDLWCPYK